MKVTNKNMRETVKQINSFALANGIFQALRCPQCHKTFRSRDFLQSHVWRKHPNQAASITIPQATPTVVTSSISPTHITLVPSSGNNNGPNASIPLLQAAPVASTTTEVKTNDLQASSNILSPSAPAKVNDVDSYRLNEVERKCDSMSDNLLRLFRELEEQKKVLEADHSRKQEEVKKAWEEKKNMEEYYELQLEKLHKQVSQLQNSNIDQVAPKDDLRELVRRQEEEVKRLHDQIQSHAAENRVEEITSLDDVDGLSEELQGLRNQLRAQERTHKKSLKDMQESLQRSYQKALDSEKDRLKDMMKDIAHKEASSSSAVIPHKPPPSPTANKSKKPPTPNLATKPSGITHVVESLPSTSESSREGRATPQPRHSLTRVTQPQPHHMDVDDTETESESKSETDTSYWNQNDLKVKHLQISSSKEKDKARNLNKHSKTFSQLVSESSQESMEEDESRTESELSSESLRLDALLRDNPHLWGQMKEATSEVLASRLSSLGIDPSSRGIKTDTLTSCLSHLRKERKTLERKHYSFHDLRKRIENEVRTKVDDKIDNVDDLSDQPLSGSILDNKRRSPGVLSRMVKNVHSKVKERSKAISTSVSKGRESVQAGVRDIFQAGGKGTDDVQVMSGSRGKVIDAGEEESSEEEEEEDSSEESEVESSSAKVDVHNETMRSVKRNLFTGGSSVASGSGTRPKHSSGYFDNRTYGGEGEEEDSETGWDSEPEYENMKEEPPKRSDSLHLSLDPADLHTTPRDTWQPAPDTHPIKVKRPSGEKVSGLTRTIEMQLSGRKKSKLAGAVDITKSFEVSSGGGEGRAGSARTSPFSTQDLQSVSESSNTIGNSMWGSGEVRTGVKEPPRPSTSRARIHSWDSEEDLDVSDLE